MEDENDGGMNSIQMIGAIKIRDGLFIGDELASRDVDFLLTNKVTHIINCAGSQIANLWEKMGISYLTFPWLENDHQVLFDAQDSNIKQIVSFVEDAIERGESTLVHSLRGQSRSCCVLTAFLMMKFKWTLYKTLEFLNSRRPDLEIRASFFHQLTALEAKLARQGDGAKSSSWQELSDTSNNIESEELLIRNTFLNAKNAAIADIFTDPSANYAALQKDVPTKLQWRDSGTNDRSKLHSAEFPFENFTPEMIKQKRISSAATVAKMQTKSALKKGQQQTNQTKRDTTSKKQSQTLVTTKKEQQHEVKQSQQQKPSTPTSNKPTQSAAAPQQYQQQQSQTFSTRQSPRSSSLQPPASKDTTPRHNKSTKNPTEDSLSETQRMLNQQFMIQQQQMEQIMLAQQNSQNIQNQQANKDQINAQLQINQQQYQLQQSLKHSQISQNQQQITSNYSQVPSNNSNQVPQLEDKPFTQPSSSQQKLAQQAGRPALPARGPTPKNTNAPPLPPSGLSKITSPSSQQTINAHIQQTSLQISAPISQTPSSQSTTIRQSLQTPQLQNSKPMHRSSSLNNFDREKENNNNTTIASGTPSSEAASFHLQQQQVQSQSHRSARDQTNNNNNNNPPFRSPTNNFLDIIPKSFQHSNSFTTLTNEYPSAAQKLENQNRIDDDLLQNIKNKHRSISTNLTGSAVAPSATTFNSHTISTIPESLNATTTKTPSSSLAPALNPPIRQAFTQDSPSNMQYKQLQPQLVSSVRSNSAPRRITEDPPVLKPTQPSQNPESISNHRDLILPPSQLPHQHNQRAASPYYQSSNQQPNDNQSHIPQMRMESLLNGISPSQHSHLTNPIKPYQRGESPSIKQKEKIHRQHQLKMQEQQHHLQQYALNPEFQNKQRTSNTDRQSRQISAGTSSRTYQLPPSGANSRFVSDENSMYQIPSSNSSKNISQASIPSTNTSGILREHDMNRMQQLHSQPQHSTLNSNKPDLQTQMNQINTMSQNLMNTLIHFPQQTQSSTGSSTTPNNNMNSNSLKSNVPQTGGYAKSTGGGPIRAMTDQARLPLGKQRQEHQYNGNVSPILQQRVDGINEFVNRRDVNQGQNGNPNLSSGLIYLQSPPAVKANTPIQFQAKPTANGVRQSQQQPSPQSQTSMYQNQSLRSNSPAAGQNSMKGSHLQPSPQTLRDMSLSWQSQQQMQQQQQQQQQNNVQHTGTLQYQGNQFNAPVNSHPIRRNSPNPSIMNVGHTQIINISPISNSNSSLGNRITAPYQAGSQPNGFCSPVGNPIYSNVYDGHAHELTQVQAQTQWRA